MAWHVGGRLAIGRTRPWVVWLATLAMLLGFQLALPSSVAAHGNAQQPVAHSLDVILVFPDAGPATGESVCVELFPDDGTDLGIATPLQTGCLGGGQERVRFGGLSHGVYRAVVPAADSLLFPARYQGQIASVEVPDDPSTGEFEIDVVLDLSPELAGTTGRIEVNVYGCPPGTNGGGDATAWRSECDALIGGAPVSVSGIGTIDDTSILEVTSQEGDEFGRVEFVNLPAGEYKLEGDLPPSVTANPAYFVESSIDGGLPAQHDPGEPVAIRPTEVLAVDVYVPLVEEPSSVPPADDPGSANPSIAGSAPSSVPVEPAAVLDPTLAGLSEPEVSGGLPPDQAAPSGTPVIEEAGA